MKLDLNTFLKEIKNWRIVIKNKDEEIEALQNQIKQSNLCIEAMERSVCSLMQDVTQYNNVISTLHHSVSKTEELETEKKTLLAEKMKMKSQFYDQEKNLNSKISELKEVIDKLKIEHKKEIEKQIKETESKASLKLQNYSFSLNEKEKLTLKLKEENSKIQEEANQKILKIKIEYEEKLNQMKNKAVKSKGFQPHHDLKSNDIFRKKYIEKEREAKEESLKLKQEIEELKNEVTLLKSSKSVSKFNSVSSGFVNFSNGEINCLENFQPGKKQKLNEDCSESNFAFLNLTSHIIKQSDGTVFSRKKLFNLDTNYFNK